MASLFDMAQTPQYVAPGGAALVTRTQGGVFGLFPGTPEYTRPEVALAPGATTPAPVMAAGPAELQVLVNIPGVAVVQGSLAVQPAVVTALLGLAQEWLDARARAAGAAKAGEAAQSRSVSDTQQRVWDRE